jgi:hypothetical protein
MIGRNDGMEALTLTGILTAPVKPSPSPISSRGQCLKPDRLAGECRSSEFHSYKPECTTQESWAVTLLSQHRSGHAHPPGYEAGVGRIRDISSLVTFEELLEVPVADRGGGPRLPTYHSYQGYADSVTFEVEREGDS